MVRLLYIDNLRSLLSVLIVGHHSALAVSGLGNWYYSLARREEEPMASALLATLLFTTQAFLTGLLFTIAGLLLPRSLAQKGPWKYLSSRLYRLALPALLLGLPIHFISQSLGQKMAELPGEDAELLPTPAEVGLHFSGPGVAWFEIWLLIFETIFVILGGKKIKDSSVAPLSFRSLLLFLGLLASLQVLVEMHLAKPMAAMFPHWRGLAHHIIHTPLYGVCFCCGSLTDTSLLLMLGGHSRSLGIACALSMLLCFIFALGRDASAPDRASNGSAVVIGAVMTVTVCAGASIGLLVHFERYFSERSPLSHLSASSYIVNLLHPVVVVLMTPVAAMLPLGLMGHFVILWVFSTLTSYGVAMLARGLWVVRTIF